MPPLRGSEGDRSLPTRDELLAAAIADLEQRIRRVLPHAPDADFRTLVRRMAEVQLKYAGRADPRPWRPSPPTDPS